MGLGASCGRNEGIQAPGGDIGGVRGWWCVGCLAIAHIRSLSLTKDVNPFAIAHGSDWHLDWIISPS